MSGELRLQLRGEFFNVLNYVNLGRPMADLHSVTVDRIFSAGPPRLSQFALKLSF